MVKVSSCTIVKNEERCLARCLESLHGIADEIIVVDTGSTDRTVEIAKEHGATVYSFEWINDFAAAKNFALSKASGNWVIFLDADEYFPDERAAKNALAAMEQYNNSRDVEGFFHIIRNFGDNGVDYINSSNSRIFRRRDDIRYKNAIHEMITAGENGRVLVTLQIMPDDFVVHHDGYMNSLYSLKEKRNLTIELAELERGNKDPLLYYYIGKDYYNAADYENAVKYLQLYFDTGNKEDCFSVSHYIFHVNALNALKRPHSQAFKVIRRGIKEYPHHPGVHFMHGFVCESASRLPQALEALDHAFELYEAFDNITEYTQNLLENNHARFHSMRARIQYYKRDFTGALESAFASLKKEKFNSMGLSLVAGLAGDHAEQVLAFLDENYSLSSPDDLSQLLASLSINRPGIVFLTLFERYFTLTQAKDLNMFTMMAVVGEYEASVNSLIGRYAATKFEPYISKALAFALLSGKDALLRAVMNAADEQYTRLCKMALGDSVELKKDDLRAFVVTLHFALGFSGYSDRLEAFARRAVERFGRDALLQLTLLYRRHDCHEAVLAIAPRALESVAAEANFAAGALAEAALESAFNAEKYDEALRFLNIARERGGHPYRLASCARFIADKLPKGKDKNMFAKLSQELFALDLTEEAERRKKLLLLEEEADDKPLVLRER